MPLTHPASWWEVAACTGAVLAASGTSVLSCVWLPVCWHASKVLIHIMLTLIDTVPLEPQEVSCAGDFDLRTAAIAALQVHLRPPCLSLLGCWSSCLSVLLYACGLQTLQGSISGGAARPPGSWPHRV